jgi:ABC-2 type transport system permease protein
MLRWTEGMTQGEPWLEGLRQLSPALHFENLAKGLLDTADLAYFALFMGFFLFVAVRALEAKRWKP